MSKNMEYVNRDEPVFKFDKETGEYIEVKHKARPVAELLGSEGYGNGISREALEKHLPKKYGGKVTDAVIEEINNIENDTGLPQATMEEVILSNMYQLEGSGITLRGLVNALKYCNLREHMNNEQAWSIVFKAESDKLDAEGRFKASHVSMYNKSELVVKVMKSMLIKSNITLQPQRAAAVQVLVNQMNGIGANEDQKVSSLVSFNAASKILDITEMDPDNTIELKMGLTDSAMEMQQQVADQLRDNAKLMRQQFQRGHSLDKIQQIGVVMQAEVIEDA